MSSSDQRPVVGFSVLIALVTIGALAAGFRLFRRAKVAPTIPVLGGLCMVLVAAAAPPTFLIASFLAPRAAQLYNTDYLVPLLRNTTAFDGSGCTPAPVLVVDRLSPELADATLSRGLALGTHHSFSFRAPVALVGTIFGHRLYAHAPALAQLVDSIAQTQLLNVRAQADLGATFFDVRVSEVNGRFMVDHGVVFGDLAQLAAELWTAMDAQTHDHPFTINLRFSAYNTGTTRSLELFDAFCAARPWLEPGVLDAPLAHLERVSAKGATLRDRGRVFRFDFTGHGNMAFPDSDSPRTCNDFTRDAFRRARSQLGCSEHAVYIGSFLTAGPRTALAIFAIASAFIVVLAPFLATVYTVLDHLLCRVGRPKLTQRALGLVVE